MSFANAPMAGLVLRQIVDGVGPILDVPDVPPLNPRPPNNTPTTPTPTLPTPTSALDPANATPTPTPSNGTSSSTTSTGTGTPTSSTPSSTTTGTPSSTATTSSETILVAQQTSVPATPEAKPATAVVIENQTVPVKPAASSPVLPAPAGAAKSSFLENKVASGIVFGLCGLVGLVLILFIIWLAMRKRRRIAALEEEIISFDPKAVGSHRHNGSLGSRDSFCSAEKGRSNSSLGYYAGNGYSANMNADKMDYRNAAPFSDYQFQRNGSVQRPGNAAFNMSAAGNSGGYGMPQRTYALPSHNYLNR